MKTHIQKMAGALLCRLDELLFPDCVLCLCCDRALDEDAQDGICPACSGALRRMNLEQEERNRRARKKLPEGIDYVYAAYPYEGPARQLVHRLKYDCVRAAHVPLAKPMVFLPSGEEVVIVPVPTDPARRRRRGYNQAELLARYVGRELGMEVLPALYRKEKRRPQTGLSAKERRLNLLGCMEAKPAVSGRRVLLIDDVYTTGATALEAARALTKAGASGVGMFAACMAAEEQTDGSDPFALPQRRANREKSLKIIDKISEEL